jgi:energy-coupling factor transporter ATP-binding protein EcfA2
MNLPNTPAHHPSSQWDDYPATYRQAEVQRILSAVRAGESASIVGLSGSGKSNLIGFLAHRIAPQQPNHAFALVDCNRLNDHTNAGFFRLVRRTLSTPSSHNQSHTELDEFEALEVAVSQCLATSEKLTLLLDRFDDLVVGENGQARAENRALFNNLRALRDSHKFKLTFVTTTRRPLSDYTELAELFYAHTIWLGPASESDALWNVQRYAKRKGLSWNEDEAHKLVQLSGGYPSLLRAACEAYAAGTPLDSKRMNDSEAVVARVREFWADQPSPDAVKLSGLSSNPMLFATSSSPTPTFDTSKLTAKELLLLQFFQQQANKVCEKDDVIRAVWPEDRVFNRGIRDDSLAQLVRRLREKIEPNPSEPTYILTVPGRGYRFVLR